MKARLCLIQGQPASNRNQDTFSDYMAKLNKMRIMHNDQSSDQWLPQPLRDW